MAHQNTPKSVLVTGCSSGFGRMMVMLFLSGGWRVFATTRRPELLSADLGAGDRLHVLPFNVAVSSERESIIRYIAEKCPSGLDCLVNNAGYGLAGPLDALEEAQIRQQFEVNFFAPLLLTRDLLPDLRRAKGKVINISSVLGFTGMPMQSMYAASKFALEGLSESLRYELLPHGVQVALVEPGGFRTGFMDGIDWPKGNVHSSPHGAHFQGYKNFLKRISQKKGNDPSQVAKAVFALAGQTVMPLRVRVGKDTQVLYYLRRSLPQKIADKVLTRISRNILETK